MDSIMGNKTWKVVDLPPGSKPFGCKWIFKKKMTVDGTIDKFKARLVVKGFIQKRLIILILMLLSQESLPLDF